LISDGKAYGHRSSKSDDFYTPSSLTEQLFENYNEFEFNKKVLEPACGKLGIVNILNNHFEKRNVYYYDIKNGLEDDFLKEKNKVDYIITNPPFKLVNQFILKCKEIATEKFALLLKTDFLSGHLRYKLCYENQNLYMHNQRKYKDSIQVYDKDDFYKYTLEGDNNRKKLKSYFDLIEGDNFKLKWVLEFVRKPDLRCEIREDGKYSTGIEAYAWYIWDKKYDGYPMVKWINNQKYIL
jgi:hypothetical protein